MSGIWPPSKPIRIELPERAVCPLPPRPLVLPWPLDSPWPRRLRRCLAPGRGFKSCKRIRLNGECGALARRNRSPLGSGRQTAAAIDIVTEAQLKQSIQGSLNDVRRVFRAERLAEHVLD